MDSTSVVVWVGFGLVSLGFWLVKRLKETKQEDKIPGTIIVLVVIWTFFLLFSCNARVSHEVELAKDAIYQDTMID